MIEPRSETPSPKRDISPAIAACPRVADLIDYALGRATSDDQSRIETHLNATDCNWCRSWLDKADGFKSTHQANGQLTSPTAGSAALFSPCRGESESLCDSEPDNAKQQREAFRDLQRRLQRLEEV